MKFCIKKCKKFSSGLEPVRTGYNRARYALGELAMPAYAQIALYNKLRLLGA